MTVGLREDATQPTSYGIYYQHENDAAWVLLGRATVSPFIDNRPLLKTGKPELRRYTAVFMLKDQEISQEGDDLVINCAP